MQINKYSGTIFLCLVLMLCCAEVGFPQTMWTKIYGGSGWEWPYEVRQMPDGGYIIAGWTDSFDPGHYSDGWLVRTDVLGDTIWTETYGGDLPDEIYALELIPTDGFLLAGVNSSYNGGVWLIRTNLSGDTIWTKDFGETIDGEAFSVRSTLDGNFILGGGIWSFVAGEYDAWLMKVDQSGDSLWFRIYGGIDYDRVFSVLPTSDNGYLALGVTESFGAGSADGWLIKTNATGDTLWTKTYGGPFDDNLISFQHTIDGGYILAGSTSSFGNGNGDAWLIKTNAVGDTIWTKTYGGTESDGIYSICQTIDGGYIMTGATRSYGAGWYDLWLIRTNSIGDTIWTKTFGGTSGDYGYSVQQTSDGGYIVAGRAVFSSPSGSPDLWLIKTDAFGNTLMDLKTKDNNIGFNNFELRQNYPNPFNPTTSISYALPSLQRVEIIVYNLLGQKVRTLVNAVQNAGTHRIEWNGTNDLGNTVGSGIYLYQLKTEEKTLVRKMILMK
jgi:hypothetical protein